PDLGGNDVLALCDQKILLLQPADDVGAGSRRADALGFLETVAKDLVIYEAPCVLHRLDQRAFAVARWWLGLFALDDRIAQVGSFAIAHRRQHLRFVTLLVPRLPFGERCTPTRIDRLTTRGLEREAFDVEACRRLSVAEVRHEGREVGSRN